MYHILITAVNVSIFPDTVPNTFSRN